MIDYKMNANPRYTSHNI